MKAVAEKSYLANPRTDLSTLVGKIGQNWPEYETVIDTT